MIYRPDDRSLSKLFENYPASFGGKKPRRLKYRKPKKRGKAKQDKIKRCPVKGHGRIVLIKR